MTSDRSPVTPYLTVRGGEEAIAFYRDAFAAEVHDVYAFDGKVGHAALTINGGTVYLADEFPDAEPLTGMAAPESLGGRSCVTINLNVEDADAWFARALKAGCAEIRAVTDEFFGRHGKLRDPYGHVWSIVEMREDADEA